MFLSVVVPIFCFTWTFFLVSLSGVFGGPTLAKLDFFFVGVIELINAKRGFFLRKEREKKNQSNNGTQGFAQLRVRCTRKI